MVDRRGKEATQGCLMGMLALPGTGRHRSRLRQRSPEPDPKSETLAARSQRGQQRWSEAKRVRA